MAAREPQPCGFPAREGGAARRAEGAQPSLGPLPAGAAPRQGPGAGRVFPRAGPSGLGAAPLHPRLFPGDGARTQLSRRALSSRLPAG